MPQRQEAAKAYIAKHKIPTLMENLLAKLLFNQPENPTSFLIAELERLVKLRTDTSQPAATLFTHQNVAALFNQYDVNRTGVITAKQYTDVYRTLALPLHITPAPHTTQAQFIDDVEASLKLKECSFY